MTVGQYLASFAIIAAFVVIALLVAIRLGTLTLVGAALGLTIAAAASFWRGAVPTNGPGAARSSVIALLAITAAAGVVYVRRNSTQRGARLLTCGLAWMALMFAWFETAYLLRS